jgi:hypothetical protein
VDDASCQDYRIFPLIRCRRVQNGKLVAANSRDGVCFLRTSPQSLCDRYQKCIARGMPKRVVDVLEIVEIEKEQREGTALKCGLFERPI